MGGFFDTGYNNNGWSYTRGLKSYVGKIAVEQTKAGLNELFGPLFRHLEQKELEEITKKRTFYALREAAGRISPSTASIDGPTSLYPLGETAGFSSTEVDEILALGRLEAEKELGRNKPCYAKRKKIIENWLSEPLAVSAIKGRIVMRKYEETRIR